MGHCVIPCDIPESSAARRSGALPPLPVFKSLRRRPHAVAPVGKYIEHLHAAFLKSPICASNARLKAGRLVQRST